MLGSLRLLFATIVALHHAGFWPWGFRWGISCAVGFFIVSGYGMSALGARMLQGRPGDLGRFYLDRALRIYPQYFFWLAASAVVVFGLDKHWLFQFGHPTWANMASNITVVPLSLFVYVPAIASLMLIPQAWSLSVELLFYGMFPFVQRSQKFAWGCALGGLAVFVLAIDAVIDPEIWAYRLLPGTLPFFMLGRALYRRDRVMQWVLLGVMHLAFFWAWLTGHFFEGFTPEIAGGVLPTFLLLVVAVHIRPRSWDHHLGDITYGCYLSQIAILAWFGKTITEPLPRYAGMALLSLCLGWVSWRLVEVPATRVRRQIRAGRTVFEATAIAAAETVG